MNKATFLEQLEQGLRYMDSEERQDILNEYETHFVSGRRAGRTEEEIADELGSPETLAKALSADDSVTRAEKSRNIHDIFRAAFMLMGLGVLNFLVVSIPLLISLAFLLFIYTMTVALLITPILFIFKAFIFPQPPDLPYDIFATMCFFGLGLVCYVLSYYITRWLGALGLRYLRWNTALVKGGGKS